MADFHSGHSPTAHFNMPLEDKKEKGTKSIRAKKEENLYFKRLSSLDPNLCFL